MCALYSVALPDRGVVRVAGSDARDFLQGLLTNDMALLDERDAIHAGLLSPQGKILFEFFVVRLDDAFLLETARGVTGELVKRLMMYKLRADVSVEDVSPDYSVIAVWGTARCDMVESENATCFSDPRHPDMGVRLLVTLASDWSHLELDTEPGTHDDYDAHRVSLGVPESGKDYTLGDTYVHEALFDQLSGVAFSKGCYVGQEVVSRVQHRSSARRRIVPVEASDDSAHLPATGTDVMAGTSILGTLGTVCGARGLAKLRIDRVAEALADGRAMTVGDVEIDVRLPTWATFDISAGNARDAADQGARTPDKESRSQRKDEL